MLNDMENDLSEATDNLEYVTRKTKELIQKSGGKKNFCIILGLIGVIVILFFLIVYAWECACCAAAADEFYCLPA